MQLKRIVSLSAAVFSLLSISHVEGDGLKKDDKEPVCGRSAKPMRVTLRHIEPNGIGYNQGYSTIDGFFSLYNGWDKWRLFLDTRLHIFNSGRPALNAGLGTRYVSNSRVWGANLYYDYRKTHRYHYNQITAGFESLGETWDFRLNGYAPVGRWSSSYYDVEFEKFKGNQAFVRQKYEYAFGGLNAEAAIHVVPSKNFPLYFAAGPYYLHGKGGTTWGGQGRASVSMYDYLKVEGNVSYDHLFKWIGQGQISLTFSFGGTKEIKQKQSNCATAMALSERSYQPVDRFEIIPVDKARKESLAINPATGEPYTFWFVDNTSHSAGTFESPFSTLAAAETASSPYDVIYVFPGDGSALAGNILLKNDQQLLGASITNVITTTLGDIGVPPYAASMPLITSSSDTFVVTLANNNTVSGLSIQVPSGSMFGGAAGIGTTSNISNFTAIQNTITGSSGFNNLNVYIANDADQVVLIGNTFNMNDGGVGVYTMGSSLNSLLSSNNIYSGGNASYAIFSESASTTLVSSTNDLFVATTLNSYGIYNDQPITTLNVTNSVFDIGYGLYVNDQISFLNSTGNTFNFIDYYGMYIVDPVTNFQSINDVFNGTDYGIYWDPSLGDTTGSLLNDNFLGSYTYIRVPDSSTYNWTVTGNTFTQAGETFEIANTSTSQVCLKFSGNSGPSSSAQFATFNNSSGGTFTWLSPASNSGVIQTTGTIMTNSPSCP